jgi:hypothetical protein
MKKLSPELESLVNQYNLVEFDAFIRAERIYFAHVRNLCDMHKQMYERAKAEGLSMEELHLRKRGPAENSHLKL